MRVRHGGEIDQQNVIMYKAYLNEYYFLFFLKNCLEV